MTIRPTRFRQLVLEREWHMVETFNVHFACSARLVAELTGDKKIADITIPPRTFDRWMAGDLKRLPQRGTRLVLHHLFGETAEKLFATSEAAAPTDEPVAIPPAAGALSDPHAAAEDGARLLSAGRTFTGPTLEQQTAADIMESTDVPVERTDLVDRRSFLTLGSIASLAPAVLRELVAPSELGVLPSTVGPIEVEQLEDAAKRLSAWDHQMGGGGIVRQAAAAQLQWAAGLLHCPCPVSVRPQLFAAVARLAHVVGMSAFDAFHHQDARRAFLFATACAEESDDWHLRAKIFSMRARQEIWTGNPDLGLTYTELGLVRGDRLTATEQAMLLTAQARAYAKLGDVQATLRAVGRADECFALSNPDEDPPWMRYYDAAQHNGDTGHALFDLAVSVGFSPGRPAQRLHTAVEGHTDAYVRSRAISCTKLATLLMITGDPEEATALGHRALDEVGQLTSRRAATDMKDLARAAQLHRADEADALCVRIASTVPS